ncbi:MAG: response regulator transcription factor [Deltaproteobacteria bacterium]|nr:response regulator transcription factor [Deltaproteobacteria bacterium]
MAERVLLIDDDDRLAAMLATWLGQRGVDVERAPDGRTGLSRARGGGFDAVVLDVMLPDLEGFEVLRQLRQSSRVPVLMLTARGDETDRIVGLEMGADDYLPKPFNPRELLARIRAVLRRNQPAAEEVLRFEELEIDLAARVVRLSGEARPLTAHQFEILRVLAESAGRVLSRGQIMERVRGLELEAFDRSIDVHVSRIRSAVEPDPKNPRRIQTIRGSGYLFTR